MSIRARAFFEVLGRWLSKWALISTILLFVALIARVGWFVDITKVSTALLWGLWVVCLISYTIVKSRYERKLRR